MESIAVTLGAGNTAPQFYPTPTKPVRLPAGWNAPSATTARQAARDAARAFDALAAKAATIATPLVCYDIAGNRNAGEILGRILYWHRTIREGERRGESRLQSLHEGKLWLAKTYAEWWDECRLSPAEAEAAIARLVALELIEVKIFKFSGDPTIHIRLRLDVLQRRWREALENPNQDGTYRPRSGSKKAESKAVTYREPKAEVAEIESGNLAGSLTGVPSVVPQEQQHGARAKSPLAPAVAVDELRSEGTQAQPCEQLSAEAETVLAQVLAVGVAPKIARDLLATATTTTLQLQLDCLADRAPQNPAAVLVKATRENWEPPAKYLQRQAAQERAESDQRDREQAQAATTQQRATARAGMDAAEAEAAQLDEAWARMPEAERAEIEREVLAQLGPVLAPRTSAESLRARARVIQRERMAAST